MAGINRRTGQPLSGWPHVVQSLGLLFTTHVGSRLMRRHFGAEAPTLLGENLTPATILRFANSIVVATEFWEPRFRIRKIDMARDANSPEHLRLGRVSMAIRGEYRPRGHFGDPTPAAGDYTLTVGVGSGGFEVMQ
jgi:phage baseplate assembly protein W